MSGFILPKRRRLAELLAQQRQRRLTAAEEAELRGIVAREGLEEDAARLDVELLATMGLGIIAADVILGEV